MNKDFVHMILMREGVACMTDGGDGVLVWEGAWEQERREVEQRGGEAGAEWTSTSGLQLVDFKKLGMCRG